MAEQLTIEKLVYGGEGLSRVNGEIIFTPFVLPGETVQARRVESSKAAQRARLEHVIEPSTHRIKPECPYFGRCGGCQYQHAEYEAQVRLKRAILAETLRRVGRIDFPEERIETIASEPYGYRNRVQFHFERGRAGHPEMGYREVHSRRLVAIEKCPIGSPKINEIVAKLNRMIRDRRWPGFLRTLEVFTDERRVQWNAVETEKPVARHFFEWLAEQVEGTVLGPLDYGVNEDTFTVGGQAFFQVNRFLLPRMAELAIGDARGETAWDLYAGVGLFSLPLARRFGKVAAVESGRAAASDLKTNARRARLDVEVHQRQTEAFLTEAISPPDFVLADPPRSGLDKGVVARLLAIGPKEIAIIACDPATLARDLTGLQTGYRIERVRMIDLFPQTFHIETIVNLVNLNPI